MGKFLQVLGKFGIYVPVVGKIESRFFHPFPHKAMSNDGDFLERNCCPEYDLRDGGYR
jgi:hypothetical protein